MLYIVKSRDETTKEVYKVAKVELKQPIVEEIKGFAQNAKAAVLVDYRGLTVAEDTELRKKLREAGVVYKVYKNTLLNFAFKGTEFEALSKDLNGPTAVAFGLDDATAPARIINDMIKKMPKLEFKAGVVEGNYYDSKGIQVVATIPSREVLISRLLGSMKSPIANLARVLKQIAEKAA
jgi:large subunit ribosomal protein L10